jgi:mannose-6-phosphate isomerase-like protein (cupin superfamily)
VLEEKTMSTPATRKNEMPHAVADGKPTAKKASFFRIRAQMLEEGRTNTALARTENLWATLKVYASGGENGLHTHPNEDHTFLVLQGRARYYDADGGHTDVGRNEGIMLPAGSYYWFEAISKEPLVLVRIGCRVGAKDTYARLNIRGEPMPPDSKENKRGRVVYREGEFFE